MESASAAENPAFSQKRWRTSSFRSAVLDCASNWIRTEAALRFIRHLAEQGLLDYIAMDIKAGPEHYPASAEFPLIIDSVQESVQWLLVRSSSI